MNRGKKPEKSRRAVSITTLESTNNEEIQADEDSIQHTSARMKELIAVLEALTDPSVKHLALDDLFFVALHRIREIMAADNLAILLVTEDKQFLTVRSVLGLEEAVASEVRIPLGRGFAGTIAAQRKPLAVHDLSTVEILTPILREQLNSLLGVPLIIEDSVIGVIHIGMKRRRIFTKADIAIFEHIARCLSQAIERTLREEVVHRARMEAAEQIEQLESFFEAITDGLMVYDQQGHIIKTNTAARRMLGIETQSEALYSATLEERAALYQIRDQSGRPLPVEQTLHMRILRGEPFSPHMFSDFQLYIPDGRKVQLHITGAPLHDMQGEINGAICVLRDVTERRSLERRVEILDTLIALVEALMQPPQDEQSETADNSSNLTSLMGQHIVELAQRVLTCSQAMMLDLDLHTQVCRPLAMIGFSAEQKRSITLTMSGTHITTIFPDPTVITRLETRETLSVDLTQSSLLQNGSTNISHAQCIFAPIKIEHRLSGLLCFIFPDADYVPTLDDKALIDAISKLSALAIEHEYKTMERDRLLKVFKHLNTQLEQINGDLLQANKRQSSFIAMVGHEFRTALTSIQGFSELLCSEEYSSSETKDFAIDISQEALRLNRMITDLLDLERMKEGKMQLYLHLLDLNAILVAVVERTRMTSPQHTILLQLDTALQPFVADGDKLTQVVANLLSNAVKYSPQGGEIVVCSMLEEEVTAHVTVKDSGMGMPANMLEKIFIPFSRVETERTHTIQGTGLGLPIVRQIIEMHGGHVWAESTPGQGSLFHFTLPLLRNTAINPPK